MKLIRKLGATSQIFQIFVADSSSTTGAGLTGLVFNTASLTAYYHRDTDTTATAISLDTMTVGTFTSSGFKEIDATNMPGWYAFCPPNAALASGASSVGFHLKGAANMAPLPIEVDLDSQVDVTSWNGTAVSSPATAGVPDVNVKNINNVAAATPGASGGILISGSNSGTTTLGALTVTGATTLAAVSGTTLTLSGAVAFQSTFAVTTSTALGALSCSTLTASGAVAFQSTFATTGTTTFNAFTVTNALTVSGTTTLTGAVTASNASNAITGIDVVKIRGTTSAGAAGYVGIDWSAINAPTTTQNLSGTTIATVTNQLTSAAIAAGVWQDTTAGDFTVASSIGKSLYTSGVVPGGSGGLLISGSNSGTTTFGALTVTGATTFTGAWTATNGGNNVTGIAATVSGTVSANVTAINSVSTSSVTTVNAVLGTATVGATAAALSTAQTGITTLLVGVNLNASQHVIVDSGTVTTVSGNVGGNVTGSIGSVASGGITAASFTAAAITSTVAPNLDAAITSRMATYTQPTGFLAATFPGGTITNNTTTPSWYTAPGTAPTVSQIATAVWQDTTAGDFTVANSIGLSLYTGFAPGNTLGGLVKNNAVASFSAFVVAGSTSLNTLSVSSTTTLTGVVTANNAGNNITGVTATVSGTVSADVVSINSISAGSVTTINAVIGTPTVGSTASALSTVQTGITTLLVGVNLNANQHVIVDSGTVTAVSGNVAGKVLGGGAGTITGAGAWVLDGSGAAVAPASTALSTAVWTAPPSGFLAATFPAGTITNNTVTPSWYTATPVVTLAAGALTDTAIATSGANRLADTTLRRSQANLELSVYGDSLTLQSHYGFVQQAQESDTTTTPGFLTVYRTDGTTVLGTRTITTDPTAEPVTGMK